MDGDSPVRKDGVPLRGGRKIINNDIMRKLKNCTPDFLNVRISVNIKNEYYFVFLI